MTPDGGGHLSPEDLQAYGQGRLEPSRVAGVERHLLECAACCEVLKATPPDSFIALLRETRPGEQRRPPFGAAPPATRAPRLAGALSLWWWVIGLGAFLLIGLLALLFSLS